MAALTEDRNTPYREAQLIAVPMKSGVTIYTGAIVVAAAGGYAEPGTEAPGLVVLGRAERTKTLAAAASDGDESILVRRGVNFQWDNADGADAVTAAHIGGPAYIVDDQTVSFSSDEGGRSRAGVITGVSSDGVWVLVDSLPSFKTILYGEADSDVANIGANSDGEVEITVTGAAAGDPVIPVPPANMDDGLAVVAWVSAANTVTMRLINTTNAVINPPAATYGASVIKL